VNTMEGTNAAIVRTTTFQRDRTDYSWFLLAVLAMALIASGLRKLFWTRTSD